MFSPVALWAALIIVVGSVLNSFYWDRHGASTERAKMVAERAIERAASLKQLQKVNAQWQETLNGTQNKQATRLAEVQRHLDIALDSLRDRPSRPAGVSAAPRTDCAGASGRELSREDAEFLVREAARADTIRAGLEACYTAYDGVH